MDFLNLNRLKLPSPAKLNLFLQITGRRLDGYHLLQTVFQLIDFADELSFFLNPSDSDITLSSNLADVSPEDNLIIKAAKLLKSTSKSTMGAKIHLTKRIPLGGGLGGGSSNAATTLIALNLLWQTKFSLSELADLGIKLGADVPVFIHGMNAFAEGIGEKLTPISPNLSWYLILIPRVNINTTEMYSHKDLVRNSVPVSIAEATSIRNNVFEPVVRKLAKKVNNCLSLLENFNEFANSKPLMSGSGSSVFASFDSYDKAIYVKERLLTESNFKFDTIVSRGLGESSLHTQLKKLNLKVD